jgi:cation diffusion facilitator CzcD-associated flavoprotein CzcO
MTDAQEVAIIGAGFAGVAAAHHFAKRGIAYQVFEASGSLGGVWRDNEYPGIACDTPSHMYSYSFFRYPWSRSHAPGHEIRSYLEEVADRVGMRRRTQFNTRVTGIIWNPESQTYLIETDADERSEFRFVVSAIGLLNIPMIPDIPGRDEFCGQLLHTTGWDTSTDARGRRVAVVGTGSSGVQLVPEIAPEAEHLYLFQREPGWILPKRVQHFSEEERRRSASALWYRWKRLGAYIRRQTTKGPSAFRAGTRQNLKARAQALAFLEREVGDEEQLMTALTPDYPFGGKRPISAEPDYFQSLRRENVTLVPEAVAKFCGRGPTTTSGDTYDVDIVVMATGFQPAKFLQSLSVVGRDGARLHDVWGSEPRAFLGIVVPGFPNFFMMYGPNTNGMGLIFMLERQAEFIARTISQARRKGATSVEVRRSSYRRYNSWLDRRLSRTVWVQTNNYFKTESGYVATQYPESLPSYWLLTRLWRRPALRMTSRR